MLVASLCDLSKFWKLSWLDFVLVVKAWRMPCGHVVKASRLGRSLYIGKVIMANRFGKYLSWICSDCCSNNVSFSQLVYHNLPMDIADRNVLLLDPILGTGWFNKRKHLLLANCNRMFILCPQLGNFLVNIVNDFLILIAASCQLYPKDC